MNQTDKYVIAKIRARRIRSKKKWDRAVNFDILDLEVLPFEHCIDCIYTDCTFVGLCLKYNEI